MTTKLAALLFLTIPLAAQADIPYPLPLHLEVRASEATLGLVCWSDHADPKSIGIVVANTSGKALQFPGLPPLLVPEAVLVFGSLAGDLSFEMPFAMLPFDLHIQAAGIVSGHLAVSPRRVIEAGYDPGDPKADPIVNAATGVVSK